MSVQAVCLETHIETFSLFYCAHKNSPKVYYPQLGGLTLLLVLQAKKLQRILNIHEDTTDQGHTGCICSETVGQSMRCSRVLYQQTIQTFKCRKMRTRISFSLSVTRFFFSFDHFICITNARVQMSENESTGVLAVHAPSYLKRIF